MKKTVLLFIIVGFQIRISNCQIHDTIIRCGTMQHLEYWLQHDQGLKSRMDIVENAVQQWITKNSVSNLVVTPVYKIPVVVHILWNAKDSSGNISDEQIRSQIDVLTKDFRKRNSDTSNTPGAFKSKAADSYIEFALATQAPDSTPTSGIIRKQTIINRFNDNAGDPNFDDIKQSLKGGDNAWPTDKYLNIWVGSLTNGLLGYAQFPGTGPDSTDGVVIAPKYFGTLGTATFPFNLGRTATHEVGHWFNLRHIWGDDNGTCIGSDTIDDTPNQSNFCDSCPPFPRTDACSALAPGIMYMNYMDYSPDACMNLFTKDQKARMRAAIPASRAGLLTTPGLKQPIDSNPLIQWQNCYGGTSTDFAYSMKPTPDGGSIVAGYVYSKDVDVTGPFYADYDFWVVKLSTTGKIQWQKCYGGNYSDKATSISLANEGGYYVTGTTGSLNGDVTGNHGTFDIWVIKISATGNLIWQKCLGGSLQDYGTNVATTKDNGCIVAGYTNSIDKNVVGNHGGYDYWVAKLSSAGVLEWRKCYGGTNNDYANSIIQDSDTSYVVAGYTESFDKNVVGNHGSQDYWILRLALNGTIIWKKCFGGYLRDEAKSIKRTSDKGFIVIGNSNSTNGNVTGVHGWEDYWVIKLGSNGDLKWQKCLGGSTRDYGTDINQTPDGGYIACGYANSTNGDVLNNHGGYDYWVVKLSSTGNLLWQKSLGGVGDEYAQSINRLSDGSYLTAGYTGYFVTDGMDVKGSKGLGDYWLVKFSQCKATISTAPSPVLCPGTGGPITLTTDEQGDYLWSNGQTTKSITVFSPASYMVTVSSGSCNAVSKPVDIVMLPCNGPIGFRLSTVSDVNGILRWQSSACDTGSYEFQMKLHTDIFWSSTFYITYQYSGSYVFNVNGLSPTTQYDVRIRSNCSADFSDWKSLTFTTLGPRISAPVLSSSFTVKPNPAYNKVTLTLKMNSDHVTISIYNVLGQNIFETSNFLSHNEYSEEMDINFLSKGFYTIVAKSEKERLIQKIVKN